jgi:hypothetical protein
MNDESVRQFRDRWKAVAAIEKQEQQTASVTLRWQQMNAIFRLAVGLKIPMPQSDQGEETVWRRWAKLKGVYT